jgi:hypothetical protein
MAASHRTLGVVSYDGSSEPNPIGAKPSINRGYGVVCGVTKNPYTVHWRDTVTAIAVSDQHYAPGLELFADALNARLRH